MPSKPLKDDPTAQSTCDVIAEWHDGHKHTIAGLSYGRLREMLQSRQKPSKAKNLVFTARNANGWEAASESSGRPNRMGVFRTRHNAIALA